MRLCQGFCEILPIYNAALKENLESLTLPCRSALLQYVDDLMIWSPTDTIPSLKDLAVNSLASLGKLQYITTAGELSGSYDHSRGQIPLTQKYYCHPKHSKTNNNSCCNT